MILFITIIWTNYLILINIALSLFDFFTYPFKNLTLWFPYTNIFTDVWFLQFGMLYLMYLIFTTTNLYYNLFYMFIQFFYFGVFLSIYQLDFFTGFLWLTECVVIFVFLLLLFYLASYGNLNKFDYTQSIINFWGFLIFLLFLINQPILHTEMEFFLPVEFNINDLWVDYYEALNNFNMNDAYPFLISYYSINSLEFLIVGFLLLVVSLIVVTLNKNLTTIKLSSYKSVIDQHMLFKNWFDYLFLRRQNMTSQQLNHPTIKNFKKKTN